MPLETIKPVLYWGGVGFYLLLELRFSYRASSFSKLKRWLTNLPLSIINGTVYHFIFFAAIMGLLERVSPDNLGLFNALGFSFWLKVVLGILVLDFVIYMWHLINHEIPLFWRFHRIHHSDMFMDVSTANRFHLGELLLSGLVRLAVIYTFGLPVVSYLLFEMLVNLSIQFHHSSIKISPAFEKLWQVLFVPPSMHRIHHSVKIKERDSNYGVILSIWDRMLGTLTTGTDQDKIITGIGSHRDFDKLGLVHLFIMPFTRKSR